MHWNHENTCFTKKRNKDKYKEIMKNKKKYIYIYIYIGKTQNDFTSCFNLFRVWPIKTDFVLTTLATRKESQIFPQHIAPETPLQHVCDFHLFEKKHINYSLFFALFFVRNKRETMRKKEKRTRKSSQETCSQLKTKCSLSHCLLIVVISVHFFSCLFISFIFFSFPACFFSCKNHYQSRPLACRPTT